MVTKWVHLYLKSDLDGSSLIISKLFFHEVQVMYTVPESLLLY